MRWLIQKEIDTYWMLGKSPQEIEWTLSVQEEARVDAIRCAPFMNRSRKRSAEMASEPRRQTLVIKSCVHFDQYHASAKQNTVTAPSTTPVAIFASVLAEADATV